MYELQREILIVNGSASAFSKSFTCLKLDQKTYAAVVNKVQINTINWDQKIEGMNNDQIVAREQDGSGTGSANARPMQVLQAKYCQMANRSQPVIVLCTTGGALIYEWMGSSLLHYLPLPKGNKENVTYMKGIGVAYDLIYIGSFTGEVFALSVKDSSIKQKATLKDLKMAVIDVEADEECAIGAAVDGTLLIWNHDFKVMNKISTGLPINVIAIFKGHAYCATVTGQITVFNIKSGALFIDIAAHARCINALNIAPEVGLMLSGSEDSFVRVWKIQKGEPLEIECTFSQAVENVPITGGAFVDSRGHAFAVTGYDYSTVFYYNRVKSDKQRSK